MVQNHKQHGSHSHPASTAPPSPVANASPAANASLFAPDSAAASELLEALDDAMFAAIAGAGSEMPTARDLWMQALLCLPPELVEESREQYLRYAADVTRRADADGMRDPAKVVVAVEVIELLAGGG